MADRLCVRDDPLLATLVLVLACLAGFTAFSGWVWVGSPPEVAEVITPRGETVPLFGIGVYRYNSVYFALGFRAQDVVLALAAAVALWATLLMRGPRALALVLAVTGFVVYAAMTLVFSAALDWLFPAYVLLFVLSYLTLWRTALRAYPGMARPGMPRGNVVAYLLFSAAGTFAVWGPELLSELSTGWTLPPMGVRTGAQTTLVTHAIDLGLIVPLKLVAAALVLRARPLGHVLALPLIGTTLLLFPSIALATALQWQAGIAFTTAEIVGPIAGFSVLGLLAGWFLLLYMKALRPGSVPDPDLPGVSTA